MFVYSVKQLFKFYMEKKTFLFCTSVFFLLTFIPVSFTETVYGYELIEKEHERIKKAAPFVKRDGDTLYLKLKSGSYFTLSDLKKCSGWDTCRSYLFVDYFKDIGFYLVFIGYYEGDEHLLVSYKNGENYLVHEAPEISPDRKRFISVSASEAYNINGVFIWHFKDEKIVPELSYEPGEYALYEFVAWKDDSTVELSKFTRPNRNLCPTSNFMRVPVFLRSDNGVWRFNEILSRANCEEND